MITVWLVVFSCWVNQIALWDVLMFVGLFKNVGQRNPPPTGGAYWCLLFSIHVILAFSSVCWLMLCSRKWAGIVCLGIHGKQMDQSMLQLLQSASLQCGCLSGCLATWGGGLSFDAGQNSTFMGTKLLPDFRLLLFFFFFFAHRPQRQYHTRKTLIKPTEQTSVWCVLKRQIHQFKYYYFFGLKAVFRDALTI